MLTLSNVTDGIREFRKGYNSVREMAKYVAMSRDEASETLLEKKIRTLPREELELFQHQFAHFAVAIPSQAKRVRAMELYTMLHLLAFNYYEHKAIGFFTDGKPLP